MFVVETTHSRDATDAFEGSKGVLNWVIQLEGAETETDAMDYMIANAPAAFTAATGTSYKQSTISISHKEEGNGLLDIEVTYAEMKPRQFSFQTGGGSEKIEYARESMKRYDAAGEYDPGDPAIPDFHGGINVTKSSIEGISIKTAQFSFKITKSWDKGQEIDNVGTFEDRDDYDDEDEGFRYLSTDGNGTDPGPPILYVMGSGGSGDWSVAAHVNGEMDGAYMADLEKLTGTYNDGPFTILIDGIWMYFLGGELFFEGTDGGKAAEGSVELTYAFSVSRNIMPDDSTSWRDVGLITVKDKRGWDVIWIYSEETEDTATHTMTRTPKAAYVERVYNESDFSKLRLGE